MGPKVAPKKEKKMTPTTQIRMMTTKILPSEEQPTRKSFNP
jgi:hypothetical protein